MMTYEDFKFFYKIHVGLEPSYLCGILVVEMSKLCDDSKTLTCIALKLNFLPQIKNQGRWFLLWSWLKT